MTEFNSIKNGKLEEQQWAKETAKNFQIEIGQLNQYHCPVCHEMWPTTKNQCDTCSLDKEKKFTIDNKMIPLLDELDELEPDIKKAYELLTQLEEMLISPVAPIMSVFRLSGGQLVNNGYCASFKQDLKLILKDIPRLPSQVEIIVIQKKTKANINKQFFRCKRRVEKIIDFLNEFFKINGIKLNRDNLNALPDYGVPHGLPIIYEDENAEEPSNNNNDMGPQIFENDDSDISDEEQCYIEIDEEDLQQVNKIKAKINVPIIDKNPLNEFETRGIISLAYPKLFPKGLADPTDKIRNEFVTETEGYRHLLKYCCKNSNGELYYPFAQHSRFLFYVADRLRRHRTLTQCKVYLKQKSADATLTIQEL